MNTRLFIEDKEIEIDDAVRFAITKEFEDVNNPTHIINDFSKTVEIPFTVNNNRLFGGLFNPSRAVVESSGETMGLYFDPTKKLDFKLLYNNTILMCGYARLNSITQKDGNGVYNITLNGSLGKLFQQMKELTFDKKNETNADYWIDGGNYVNTFITKDLVADTFVSEQQQIELEGAQLNDIIGFVPSVSYNDDFNSDNVELNDDRGRYKGIMEFKTILEEKPEWAETKVSTDSVIGDGLTPRQYGEFRSYYQQPYIYFNKLMQIFSNEVKNKMGYDADYDVEWFNNANPYWKDLVYMLKPLNIKEGEGKENLYNFYAAGFGQFDEDGTNWTIEQPTTLNKGLRRSDVREVVDLGGWESNPNFIPQNGMFISVNDVMPFELLVLNADADKLNRYLLLNPENGLVVRTYIVDENDNEIEGTSRETAVVPREHPDYAETYDEIINWNETQVPIKPLGQTRFSFDLPIVAKFSTKQMQSFKVKVSVRWMYNDANHKGFYIPSLANLFYLKCQVVNKENVGVRSSSVSVNTEMKRSYSNFTLNDLWNSEFNLFDEIIRYCKLFRLMITVDEVNKRWKIERITKYFRNYSIKHWEDKINLAEDFKITPITFDTKYVLFNYNDSDVSLNTKYKDKYGINYGEYRLITDYNFNTETKELFDNTNFPSIVYTDNILDWTHIYEGDFTYLFPKEMYVLNGDRDNKRVDVFGAMYFRNGFETFNPQLRGCKVTDDTPKQLALDKYCYTDLPNNSINVYKYPKLDIVKDNVLCVYTPPMESYVYGVDYSTYRGIYDIFWKNYLDERYNVQNNLLDCSMQLNQIDYLGFDYRNFITFNNRLYMINKITDYDVQNVGTTNVELISVSDLDSYTKDNWLYFALDSDVFTTDESVGMEYLPIHTNGQIVNIEVIPDGDYYGRLLCNDANGEIELLWEHFEGEDASGIINIWFGAPTPYVLKWHIDGTLEDI